MKAGVKPTSAALVADALPRDQRGGQLGSTPIHPLTGIHLPSCAALSTKHPDVYTHSQAFTYPLHHTHPHTHPFADIYLPSCSALSTKYPHVHTHSLVFTYPHVPPSLPSTYIHTHWYSPTIMYRPLHSHTHTHCRAIHLPLCIPTIHLLPFIYPCAYQPYTYYHSSTLVHTNHTPIAIHLPLCIPTIHLLPFIYPCAYQPYTYYHSSTLVHTNHTPTAIHLPLCIPTIHLLPFIYPLVPPHTHISTYWHSPPLSTPTHPLTHYMHSPTFMSSPIHSNSPTHHPLTGWHSSTLMYRPSSSTHSLTHH